MRYVRSVSSAQGPRVRGKNELFTWRFDEATNHGCRQSRCERRADLTRRTIAVAASIM